MQRALAGGVQMWGGQGPSYCERSPGRARSRGPALPPVRDPDQGKDQGEECLPWGGLVLPWPWISCSSVSSRDLRDGGEEDDIGLCKNSKSTLALILGFH